MAATFAFIIAILVAQTLQETCYWQSGDVADGYVACQGGSGSCCDSNDACFSNGMCLGGNGFLYQGSCTIQGWGQGTDGCFSECDTNSLTPHPNPGTSEERTLTTSLEPFVSFAPISPCQGKICCGWAYDAADCCDDDSQGFQFESDAFVGHFNSSLFVNLRRSIASSEVARAATATATVTVTANAKSANQIGNGYVKNSVPIGVGVALGVALLVAVGIIIWLLMKLKRAAAVPAGPPYYPPRFHPVEAGGYEKPYEVQHNPRFEVQGTDVAELHHGSEPRA